MSPTSEVPPGDWPGSTGANSRFVGHAVLDPSRLIVQTDAQWQESLLSRERLFEAISENPDGVRIVFPGGRFHVYVSTASELAISFGPCRCLDLPAFDRGAMSKRGKDADLRRDG